MVIICQCDILKLLFIQVPGASAAIVRLLGAIIWLFCEDADVSRVVRPT